MEKITFACTIPNELAIPSREAIFYLRSGVEIGANFTFSQVIAQLEQLLQTPSWQHISDDKTFQQLLTTMLAAQQRRDLLFLADCLQYRLPTWFEVPQEPQP